MLNVQFATAEKCKTKNERRKKQLFGNRQMNLDEYKQNKKGAVKRLLVSNILEEISFAV